MNGTPLSPGVGRWPRSAAKRARRREQLKAATEFKRAMEKRCGMFGSGPVSQGAASDVRIIDPKTGEVIGTVPAKR